MKQLAGWNIECNKGENVNQEEELNPPFYFIHLIAS